MIPDPVISILKLLISKLPNWFISYFYKPDKIANFIDVDLRSKAPINIHLEMAIPEINLYFHISNRSHFELTLDRLLIDLSVGQPTLKGAILRRYVIPKAKSINDIYFSCPLTFQQQKQIKDQCKGQILSVPILITTTAYFESKAGIVCKENQIERLDVLCK